MLSLFALLIGFGLGAYLTAPYHAAEDDIQVRRLLRHDAGLYNF